MKTEKSYLTGSLMWHGSLVFEVMSHLEHRIFSGLQRWLTTNWLTDV